MRALVRLLAVTSCISCVAATAGCGAVGSATFKPTGIPVEFSVDTSGNISIGVGHEFVTPIGTFGINVSKQITPDNTDAVVTILHYQAGESKKSLYKVRIGEALYVDVAGRAHLKFASRAVEVTAERGTETKITVRNGPPTADSYAEPTCPAKAPAPELTISPTKGSVSTLISLTGVGFVVDGKVDLSFGATNMGEARTDCAGRFSARLHIPDPDFWRHLPGQQRINTTEYDGHGQYVGNGDPAYFQLTG